MASGRCDHDRLATVDGVCKPCLDELTESARLHNSDRIALIQQRDELQKRLDVTCTCADMANAKAYELFPIDHVDAADPPLGELRYCPWCGGGLT